MAVLNESASFLVSVLLALLSFSSLQVLKPTLASTQAMTVAGGALASMVFVFLLTALGNLEKVLMGSGFASKWVEVCLCLAAAVSAAASVHRVCATTCVLFSAVWLYGMFKVSNEVYGAGTVAAAAGDSKNAKKRK